MINAREGSGRNSLVGYRIGKFDVIAEIGTGGMASVYLARATGAAGFNRLVAIKVMHPHLSNEDSFVEMFLDEARVAATIQHPNVVSIIDVGIEDGLIFLIMEYVEGDSFSSVEKMAVTLRRRIPVGITLRITLDALAGLHHAHELNDHQGRPLRIIHRDVSPQNIMVGVDGTARIVDFGIAKAESRITTTQVGLIKGKLNFMAPEQIRSATLDRRVDVFGMGVTLWEAITLRRLFAGANEFETAKRILAGEYPTLHEFDPKLPPVLDEICRKALHPDPDQRYLTAAEFGEDIEDRLGTLLAGPREVAAFITGVAAQKLERERRAVRESMPQAAAPAAPAPDADEDFEEPDFMSSTVVEMPAKAPTAIGPAQPLPSTAAPRDRSEENATTATRSRFRAPTMSMPGRGGANAAPPSQRASGVVVSQQPEFETGAPTRALRIPAQAQALAQAQAQARARAEAPPAGEHEAYEDDGATSPFHSMDLVAQARAFRAIQPSKPAAPSFHDDDDEGEGDGDTFSEGHGARTLFEPVQTAPSREPFAPAPMPQSPLPAARPMDQQAFGQAPMGQHGFGQQGGAASTMAMDLVQRRPPGEDSAPQRTAGPYDAGPYQGQYAPQQGFAQHPTGAPTPATASQQPAAARPARAVPALVYALLSLILVGGAASVLWYVLRAQ